MQFKPQDETRKKVEDELIQKALENFRRRAVIVQDSMGASGYRVMQVSINTGDRPVQTRQHGQEAYVARSMSNAPAVEAGQSKITVGVSGRVQLQ